MDYLDLVDRLVPTPAHTLIVESPQGELVLVDTKRQPKAGDRVLAVNDMLRDYEAGIPITGVAYCVITFL